MADELLLETTVNKPNTAEAIGCFAAIPLILGVVVGVNLFIGESELPREIRGTTPWLVLATLVTGGFAFWFWRRSRIKLQLIRKDGVQYLEIYDPSAPLVLQGPFTDVRYGWASVHMPKVGTQTLIIVGIYQDGELEVSLLEQWGSLYSAPHGWPGDFALEGTAKAAYTAAGLSFLPELVRQMEDP